MSDEDGQSQDDIDKMFDEGDAAASPEASGGMDLDEIEGDDPNAKTLDQEFEISEPMANDVTAITTFLFKYPPFWAVQQWLASS